MKLIRSFSVLLVLNVFGCSSVTGQHHQERYEAIDVDHYRFEVDLNDTTDMIRGSAQIEIMFKTDANPFYLDLKSLNKEGFGMITTEVRVNGEYVEYVHQDDRIYISDPGIKKGATRIYQIKYQGVPGDGLIISENKFGDRTFFGDNWPDRAHHWLPVVDHPSDKAIVEFLVHAPSHYKVVANGQNIEEFYESDRIFSHWRTTVPLPTKLMVIGVSPFAVQCLKSRSGIPVSSWVFPQNSEEGFYDYCIATRPLDFFEAYIAPYPYYKLANVQSKTVYGGMENASCIFYRENSVTGKRNNETLFTHEIAHQWFGDAVSELNWHHIWISEGFATYLTDLYLERIYGREVFVSSMKEEKEQVLRYSRRRLAPIVDTMLAVSIGLLNNNSYEKAGWVLHMLRRTLGDDLFRECIRTFYEEYKFGNALTEDFERIVEIKSGRDFSAFFNQWFYQSGQPVLSSTWKYKRNMITLTIKQHQDQCVFQFPLEIRITDKRGESFEVTLLVNASEQTFHFRSTSKPDEIKLDPESWLLYESY